MYRWFLSFVLGDHDQGDHIPERGPKMKIWVATPDDRRIQFNVGNDDFVKSLMCEVQDAEGHPFSSQRMIYSGKQMEQHRTFSSYGVKDGATISLVLKTQPSGTYKDAYERPHYESRSTDRRGHDTSQTSFDTPPAIIRRVDRFFQTPFSHTDPLSERGFDGDEVLLNPERYYEKLDDLEKVVVESSEYYRTSGKYITTISDAEIADAMYASSHCSLDVWRCFDRFLSSKPSADPSSAISLGNSYLVLSRTLDILEDLTQKRFCDNSFTILFSKSTTPLSIAGLVQVERTTIVDFHDALGDAILAIFKSGVPLPEDATTQRLEENLMPAVKNILACLDIPPFDELAQSSLLQMCRVLALMLDLGLVSYMGSHGTRFDLEYLDNGHPELFVNKEYMDAGFRLRLQKLACLDGFLDGKEVWTFLPFWLDQQALRVERIPTLIFTSIQAFADTWGPLWGLPAGEDFPEHYRQLNVGTGCIRRTESDLNYPIPGTVTCHWFNSLEPLSPPSAEQRDNTLIPLSHKLLIGGLPASTLGPNKACIYKLDDLERDYGLYMTPLGTNASSWIYDERQIGFSASQYIGITVMGTQKKLPCITQKRAIWNKWTNQPTRANPRILNSYLGVEISHCTGNARRVKLRDIFTMKPVQDLLERQFPDWKTTEFGPSFQLALNSATESAIENIWLKHHKSRGMMAELVCCVLEMFEKTGMSRVSFNAIFLNQQREFSMPIQPRLNRWAQFLEDSHLTAVYAIVNDNCLMHNGLAYTGHSIATCNSVAAEPSDGLTIFETHIAVPKLPDLGEKIWLNERGFFQRVSSTKEGVHLVTWDLGRTRELGSRLGRLLRSKQEPNLGREVQDSCELGGQHIQVLVKSTVSSYGGLPSRKHALTEQVTTGVEDSLELRTALDESLVMLAAGGCQNI